MNDDMNPNRPNDLSEDALSRAFEELIEERSSHVGTPREDAPVVSSAGTPGLCAEPVARRLPPCEEADLADAMNLNELLAHAAQCPACAERLHTVFAEASPEEAAQVSELSSA